MFFDMPLEQLEVYKPKRVEPADFDAFWKSTLDESRAFPLNARFESVETGLKFIDTFDVTYNGYLGQPIKGWFFLPKGEKQPLPCIVEYIGYNGGRGFPIDWLTFANMGYAHFVMDTRGQGSLWRTGETPDIETEPGNPSYPGFMTRGVLNPKTYFYRRVFTDAVRAVEAARSNNAVDTKRIAITGGSQGGGITLAVAGLVPDLAAAMADVPFLCHYRRATELVDSFPYSEISLYLKAHRDKVETVFNTLSYFDGVNFSARANASALICTGLMDEICPPSTVFAAYNHYAGPKKMKVYPYNHHENGETFQTLEKLSFLKELWG